VRELTGRPSHRGANVVSLDSGSGLANATIQQRLVPVRLFYDHLIEEGVRLSNPVGRGRYTPSRRWGGHQRGLVPRLTKLPWIPTEQQWLEVLGVAAEEPVRNRLMLALAYDAALRREELCSFRTDDLDPAHRTPHERTATPSGSYVPSAPNAPTSSSSAANTTRPRCYRNTPRTTTPIGHTRAKANARPTTRINRSPCHQSRDQSSVAQCLAV
jgi:integrase